MRLLAFSAAVAVALAFPALAQEPAPNIVDLGPLMDELGALVAGALIALAGWAIQALRRWSGVKLDARYDAAIDAAIARGVDYAMKRLGERARFESQSAVVSVAAGYVVDGVPKALRHFGIDQERVRRMVEARLPPGAEAEKQDLARPRGVVPPPPKWCHPVAVLAAVGLLLALSACADATRERVRQTLSVACQTLDGGTVRLTVDVAAAVAGQTDRVELIRSVRQAACAGVGLTPALAPDEAPAPAARP